MKTLLLMRHGKSDWKDEKKKDDRMRPLTKKGIKDTHKMGELLEEKELYPQVILSSSAVRARETALPLLTRCCAEMTYITLDSLYMAEPQVIVDAIKTLSDGAERVLVIGHNPGLEGLFQMLTGKVESLPTASIAYLELPIARWNDLSLETQATQWEKWKPKDA